jgi:hypothetical protein
MWTVGLRALRLYDGEGGAEHPGVLVEFTLKHSEMKDAKACWGVGRTGGKMSMHISKMEAEAEAIRIAEAFVSASIHGGSPQGWECIGARPDVLSPDYTRRKSVIKWNVIVRWIPEGGGIFDGDGIIKVDIDTKEARWMETP